MDREQALHNFWAGFSFPAYDETSVPSGTALPYITYEVATSDFGSDIPLAASIWMRDPSWAAITAKCDEIGRAIGRGGKQITYDNGAFWIRKANVFAQRMAEPNDDMVRRILINIFIEYMEA